MVTRSSPRPASSGRYAVIGSSTLVMSPSAMAVPTSADTTDLATENEVCIELRWAPLK